MEVVTYRSSIESMWIRSRTRAGRRLHIEQLEGRDLLAALAELQITALPESAVAGTRQTFLLTALDSTGSRIVDYDATVSFSTNDPLGVTPLVYTFTPTDRGDKTFSATFKTAGLQTLFAIDTAAGVAGEASLIVTNAAIDSLEVAGFPTSTVAGDTHPFIVTAIDTYGNTVVDYGGTVTFSSSDINAVLPPDYNFTSVDGGTQAFEATLRNTGASRSIIATDTVTGLTGMQKFITVETAPIRYSASSNTIYVESVAATLSDIAFIAPHAPLTLVDSVNGVWKLDANIRVVDGGSLMLHGTAIGGDVNELRLKSENTLDPNAFVEIRADYGQIDIQSTKITSWDSVANGPDTEYEVFGRAYVRARSRLSVDGTPLESRMDITSSDIGYLGYDGSEAYGISLKVVGDPGPGFELFEQADVYGDIRDSYIHHNYFGIYSFGAYGAVWSGNEVAFNVVYGIDPHDDSDWLLIEDNFVHHNGSHGIIGSKRTDHLTIRNNMSSYNGKHGIMLHQEANDSLIEGNTVIHNGETGIAIFDSYRSVVRNNIAQGNQDSGIRLSVGSSDNLIQGNTSTGNLDYGVYLFQGSNFAPRVGDDGRPKRNVITGNDLSGNGSGAIRFVDSDDNIVGTNTLTLGTPTRISIQNGNGNSLRADGIPAGVEVELRGLGVAFEVLAEPGGPTGVFRNSGVIEVFDGAAATLNGDGGAQFSGGGVYRANAGSVIVVSGGADASAVRFETVSDGVVRVEGDYNENLVVDAADFTVWRKTLGQTLAFYNGADGNGNGAVDQADYVVWRSNFGATISAPIASASSESVEAVGSAAVEQSAAVENASQVEQSVTWEPEVNVDSALYAEPFDSTELTVADSKVPYIDAAFALLLGGLSTACRAVRTIELTPLMNSTSTDIDRLLVAIVSSEPAKALCDDRVTASRETPDSALTEEDRVDGCELVESPLQCSPAGQPSRESLRKPTV